MKLDKKTQRRIRQARAERAAKMQQSRKKSNRRRSILAALILSVFTKAA